MAKIGGFGKSVDSDDVSIDDGEGEIGIASGPEPTMVVGGSGGSGGEGTDGGVGGTGGTGDSNEKVQEDVKEGFIEDGFYTGYCQACGMHIDNIQLGVSGDPRTFTCPGCGNENTV